MEVQNCSAAGILAGKGGPYLGRGQFHKWTVVPILEIIDLSQDWGGPMLHWCAFRLARFKEFVFLQLH
eukprot:12331055-Heterocapsa_arctica.AAC.1